MMNLQERKAMEQCRLLALGKVMVVIAVVAISWLSACPAESQAQRLVAAQAGVGPVAEKPRPPGPGSTANAPVILSVANTDNLSVTIKFQDLAAKVGRKTFEMERRMVGSPTWHRVYSNRIHDHRIPFDPRARDHRRIPGAKFVHRDTMDLTAGKTYLYRVRATLPYEPQPSVLLSAHRTIKVKASGFPTTPGSPTPPGPLAPPDPTPPSTPTTPDPTQPDPTPTDISKMVYLKARPIGPLLRPYIAVSLIPGDITEIEIPEVNGKTLWVYFLKPGRRLDEFFADPDATVMLTSGQSSTPSQINELFGTNQQKLHFKFVAFVRASPGKQPNSVAMKVSYKETN